MTFPSTRRFAKGPRVILYLVSKVPEVIQKEGSGQGNSSHENLASKVLPEMAASLGEWFPAPNVWTDKASNW